MKITSRRYEIKGNKYYEHALLTLCYNLNFVTVKLPCPISKIKRKRIEMNPLSIWMSTLQQRSERDPIHAPPNLMQNLTLTSSNIKFR